MAASSPPNSGPSGVGVSRPPPDHGAGDLRLVDTGVVADSGALAGAAHRRAAAGRARPAARAAGGPARAEEPRQARAACRAPRAGAEPAAGSSERGQAARASAAAADAAPAPAGRPGDPSGAAGRGPGSRAGPPAAARARSRGSGPAACGTARAAGAGDPRALAARGRASLPGARPERRGVRPRHASHRARGAVRVPAGGPGLLAPRPEARGAANSAAVGPGRYALGRRGRRRIRPRARGSDRDPAQHARPALRSVLRRAQAADRGEVVLSHGGVPERTIRPGRDPVRAAEERRAGNGGDRPLVRGPDPRFLHRERDSAGVSVPAIPASVGEDILPISINFTYTLGGFRLFGFR